jgi:hypothetical protein
METVARTEWDREKEAPLGLGPRAPGRPGLSLPDSGTEAWLVSV